MVEVAPVVRSRVPTTAGPWQLVGRFDVVGSELPSGRITGPGEIEEPSTWLQRFDAGLAQLADVRSSAGPSVRQLVLPGRPIFPAPASPTSLRSSTALREYPDGIDDGAVAFDPARPFLITSGVDPMAPGADVTDGLFEVNGVTVRVTGFDNLYDVLDRINRSGAGVSARYDVTAAEVHLVSVARGASARITVGNDTSGFLIAFGLHRPAVVSGHDAGYERPAATLGGLTNVRAGAVVANGVAVWIDPGVESIMEIADRITAATDARVRFDLGERRLLLGVDLPPGSLDLDDGTGLFEAAGLRSGVYRGDDGRTGETGAMVIRSWSGPADRVESRASAPGDIYQQVAARTAPDRTPTAPYMAPGHGAINDRIAGSVCTAVSLGSDSEAIAIARCALAPRQR